jgi:6-pyruvoyltetrahydropterin/6-carboxytetrahydropterin synthase
MFRSTKLFSGYSCCFRQWRATSSHCRFLHGYALSFRVTFAGELDERNWVCDFGCFKKNGIKDSLAGLFDHTTLIAQDDPERTYFEELHEKGLIQLRIVTGVGAERFAELVCTDLNRLLNLDSEHSGRVRAIQVECFENDTNSAIYLLD